LSQQEQTLRLNGIDLFYRVRGDGPPLVMLHGFFGSGALWEPYLEELGEHFRLIIPDLRGHGRSTNPARQFTHRQAALDIYALLDALGIERTRGVGASTGSMTLLHMATQQPQRVEAMVLFCGTSYYPEQARAIMRASTMASAPPERIEELRHRHAGGDAQIEALFRQFGQFQNSYDDMNFTAPYLSTITARTLIVHGDRDEFFPVPIPVEMYRAIPNSALWIVPQAGHGNVIEAAAGATPEHNFPVPALRFLTVGL
jgi:pimeloyl-ACP methyl ester carboxylesterase